MNILLIISPFAPAQTPNTLRWLPLIEEMQRRGHKVYVITSKWSDQEKYQYDFPVYRRGHHSLLDAYYNLSRRKKRRNILGSSPSSPSLLNRLLEKLIDITWRKWYWPDGSMLFLRSAQKHTTDIIKNNKISHVISVGLPFSCHYLAYKCKHEFPNLKWLMDVEDPFSISEEFWVNNFKKYRERNFSVEKKVLNVADSISFTNEEVLKIYKEKFPESSEAYFIAPPLFHHPQLENITKTLFQNTKKKICYIGSFYENVRSPESFLKLIEYVLKKSPPALDAYEFHFFGECDKFSNPIFHKFNHLKSLIIRHGFMSRDEALAHILDAHMVLNFGNTTNYHLPSKVVDLLYLNKPVINIITREDDLSKSFLGAKLEILNLLVGDDNLDTIAEEFMQFITMKSESEPNLKAIQEFTTESIADLYLNRLAN